MNVDSCKEADEGKSYKANLHGKSGVIGFWAGIAQPDRFYQSWKVAQNACLLHYFLVKWFLFESQDSTFEPFQEAACTVQKLYTMKNHWKMYHGATEVHPLTRPEMYSGRAFERYCAKYCSIATEKPCASNSICYHNFEPTWDTTYLCNDANYLPSLFNLSLSPRCAP